MDDGWNDLRERLHRKKATSLKRRQMEVLIRSETVRDLYHEVVESIVDLYKDNGAGLRSWHHFRAAADKLAELHKFMKLTIARVYELGTIEGMDSYSYEFFEKLRDFQAHSNSPRFVPFDYLRGYLSRPDDPPPKRMKRDKRVASHRRYYHPDVKTETYSSSLTKNSNATDFPFVLSNLKTDEACPSSSVSNGNREREQAMNRSEGDRGEDSAVLSPLPREMESYLSEDSSGGSSCSCVCGEDSLTDTSSSANEEEDGDCHSRQRFITSQFTSRPPF